MAYYSLQVCKYRKAHTAIVRFDSLVNVDSLNKVITSDGYSVGLVPLSLIELDHDGNAKSLFSVQPMTESDPIYVLGSKKLVEETYKPISVPGFDYSFTIKDVNVITDSKDLLKHIVEYGAREVEFKRAVSDVDEEIKARNRQLKLLREKKERMDRTKTHDASQIVTSAVELLRFHGILQPIVSEDEEEIPDEEVDDFET